MAINKKLIFWNNSSFNPPTSSTDTTQDVLWNTIVFFGPNSGHQKEIWTHGVYFSSPIWGTETAEYVPVTISGVTKNLSLNGHTHGLLNTSLAAPASIDGLTATNFRTTLFGSSSAGYDISTSRWHTTPSVLSTLGLSDYGTAIAWAGSDTHGFLALNYNSAGAVIGGGDADLIKWTAKLYHSLNANLTTVPWNASTLTLAGAISGVTSLTMSGAIGGATSISASGLIATNSNSDLAGFRGNWWGSNYWGIGGKSHTIRMGMTDGSGNFLTAPGDLVLQVDGNVNANGFVKSGSSNSYLLLGGGGHTSLDSFNTYEANLQWGGKNFNASYGCLDAAMVPFLGANRLAFANPTGITIEYSRDAGVTWIDYGATDAQKRNLTSGADNANLVIGHADATNKATADYQLRITFNTGVCSIYTQLNKFCIYISSNGSTGSTCTIEKALESTPDTYSIVSDMISIGGLSGYNIINTSTITTYGNTPTSQYGRLRFTFKATGGSSTYNGLNILNIFGYGGVGWITPSNMARWGQIYSYNSSQNVTFPGIVAASSFSGNVTGNVSGVLNVYSGNECVIHNGYSGNSSVWINYRGATGTGITEYNMGNGLSAGGRANVRANSFIGSLTGNADSATTATKITATSSTTTQAYLLGVTASGTTPIYDPGIYITSTSGTLHATYMTATTFTGNLTGTATSADTLDGYHADTSSTGGAWSFIPTVKSDGTMGVGRYIDFHHVSNDGSDYKARLHTDGSTDGQLFINGNKIWTAANLTNLNQLSNGPGYITSSGSISGNAASASLLANLFGSRPTSPDITQTGSGGLSTFKATSSMTTNKPASDGHIIHMYWDNTGGYDSQLFVGTDNNNYVQYRNSTAGTWNSWITLLDSLNYKTYTVDKTGTGATGTWNININGSAQTLSNVINGYSGTYGLTVNVSGTLYTNSNLTYNGTTNTLTSPNFAGNLSGTASNATNISNSGTVTLASAIESNAITITQPSYTPDQPVKLLNFNWYTDAWSIGNIRSGGTASSGLGVYLNSVEKFRFINGVFKIGTNTAYHAGNFSVTLNGTSTTSAAFYAPTSQLSAQASINSYLIGATSTTSLSTVYSNAGIYMNGSKLYAGDIQSSGNITASNLWGISSKDISLTLTTDWQDTGILMNDSTLFSSGSGTYIIELYTDAYSVGSGYGMRYSGVMAVYTGSTNSTNSDEIMLHSCGHASLAKPIYLRTALQVTPNYAKIQIASSAAWIGAGTITIKTRRII